MTGTFDAVFKVMSRKQIQSIYEAEHARIALWTGAISAGKTISSTLAFIMALVRAPMTGLVVITGYTIPTIEKNIIDVLMNPSGPFGPLSRYIHHTRGSTTAVMFGRVVHLVGASDIRAEGRLRGSTVVLALADEITLLPEGFFTMLLSRLRVPGARLLGSSNPDSPSHWLRQNFMLRANEPGMNLRHWHFTIEDNPSLEQSYIDAVKAEYTGLYFKRFILGLWVLAEGAVFDSWDPDVCVVTDAQMPQITAWVSVGVDYGITNPFAAVAVGLGKDGRLYAVSEYYYDSKKRGGRTDDAAYAESLRDWMDGIVDPRVPDKVGMRPKYIVVDPSAASYIQALKKVHLSAYDAENAVMDGIRVVSALIATRRLLVHESCRSLIAEIPSYCWDPKAAEKGEDAPIKVADHAIDALRYGIYTTQSVWHNALCPPNTPLPIAA